MILRNNNNNNNKENKKENGSFYIKSFVIGVLLFFGVFLGLDLSEGAIGGIGGPVSGKVGLNELAQGGATNGQGVVWNNISKRWNAGSVTAMSGDGSLLTNLNAANLAVGGTLPALNGASVTNLDAGNLASGTAAEARLPSVHSTSNWFGGNLGASGLLLGADAILSQGGAGDPVVVTGASGIGPPVGDVGNLTGTLPALNGANLTNLNSTNLTGTVADARLSTNVWGPNNVVYWGADPAGIIDSWGAISNCAQFVGTGEVKFPSGTFLMSAALDVNTASSFVGDMSGGTIIKATATNDLFTLDNVVGVDFSGLQFQTTETNKAKTAIRLSYAPIVKIENCIFTGWSNCVWIDNIYGGGYTWGISIEGCSFGASRHGVWCDDLAVNSMQIGPVKNYFDASLTVGARLSGTDIKFTGNTVQSCTNAIVIPTGTSIGVVGNYFEANYLGVVDVCGGGQVSGLTVQDNYANLDTGWGTLLYGRTNNAGANLLVGLTMLGNMVTSDINILCNLTNVSGLINATFNLSGGDNPNTDLVLPTGAARVTLADGTIYGVFSGTFGGNIGVTNGAKYAGLNTNGTIACSGAIYGSGRAYSPNFSWVFGSGNAAALTQDSDLLFGFETGLNAATIGHGVAAVGYRVGTTASVIGEGVVLGGAYAGYSAATIPNGTVLLGYHSGYGATSLAEGNVIQGYFNGTSPTTIGLGNVLIGGENARMGSSIGQGNVIAGYWGARTAASVGSGNIILGYKNGQDQGGSGNILLGVQSHSPWGVAANGTMNIGSLLFATGMNVTDSPSSNACGGSFGVNTTNLVSTLNVGGNSRLDGTLTVTGAITGPIDATNITSGTVAEARLSANVALLDRSMQAFTGGTNSFSGRVGIGTTNPLGALHVVGNLVRIGDGGTVDYVSGDGSLYVKNNFELDGTAYLGTIIYGGNFYASASVGSPAYRPRTAGLDTIFQNSAGTEQMRILNAGNVGIGTVSPGAALHTINSAGPSVASFRVDSDAANTVLVKTNSLMLSGTITAGGTTGNQTINKICGTVNIAALGTSVSVTNSLCSANSLVFPIIRTGGETAVIQSAVCGAGWFTITLSAATVGEVSVGWWLLNIP